MDNANVRVKSNNSLLTRLKLVNPKLILMHCNCHSGHIASGEANKALPKEVDYLLRSLVTYIINSSKRSALLEKFHFVKEKSKLLKPTTIRWLSLQHCVIRVLEHWNSLNLFY